MIYYNVSFDGQYLTNDSMANGYWAHPNVDASDVDVYDDDDDTSWHQIRRSVIATNIRSAHWSRHNHPLTCVPSKWNPFAKCSPLCVNSAAAAAAAV